MLPAVEPIVTILVPVLDRPQNVAPLVDSIRAATPEPHEILFLLDAGDTAEIDAVEALDLNGLIIGTAPTYPEKINEGFLWSRAPWVMQGADDLRYYPGWLAAALRAAGDRYGVVGTNDLHNPRVLGGYHSTHSLIRREYVEKYGLADGARGVMFEGYRHTFCDDELVATAQHRGQFVHCHDSRVEHLHPYFGGAEMDDTYAKGMKTRFLDEVTFSRRGYLWGGSRPTTRTPPARSSR